MTHGPADATPAIDATAHQNAAHAQGGTAGAYSRQGVVDVDASKCAPGWTVSQSGRVVFDVQNSGTTRESVSLLGAPQGIAVAAPVDVSAAQVATVKATLKAGGGYQWHCQTSAGTVTASSIVYVATRSTGSSTVAPVLSLTALIEPLGSYIRHEDRLLARLEPELALLERDIAAGTSTSAKQAWMTAHLTWLELGQDDGAYGAFGAVGQRIDGTTAGLAGGSANPAFSGFHRVELDLWKKRDLERAGRDAATLSRLVATLTPAAVRAALPSNAFGMNAWTLRCHEVLEDALRDSLSQRDNYGSNTDVASISADVSATREMLAVLGPVINSRSRGLVARGHADLQAIDATIAEIHHGRATWQEPSTLPGRERQRLDAEVGAALETLAPVSELMELDTK
jgi:hypothetical protein